MHRWMTDRARLFALALGLFCALASKPAAAADARTEVVAALEDLNEWLGSGANGQKWNRFLRSDQLQQALQDGEQANPVAIAEIYSQYTSVTPGPRTVPIERVRLALENWLNELADVPAADLPELVRGAKDQISPPNPETVGRVRKRARAAFQRLSARLQKAGENGRHWRQHLLSDELEAQLAADQPDVAKLEEIQGRFVGAHAGLELASFVEVRSALGDYADQVNLNAVGDESVATFHALLDDLATRLEGFSQQPSPIELELIGESVSELERYGQAPRVVWAVRRHFAQPNLNLHASQAFLTKALARDVDDVAPVRDMILGTDIHGTGRTIGRSEIVSVPSAQHAMLRLMLHGTTYTKTVGYNGPVQIHSSGATKIDGQKTLILRPDGLYAGPSQADAETHTKINGITTRRHGPIGKFILKAANKRAAQSKAQAERIAARHAEERIRARLDSEAGARLTEANERYQAKFVAPLMRYDLWPERLQYATTAAGLNVVGEVRASDRLAADRPAPEMPANSDLVLSLHESAVNNITRGILLGRTLTQTRAIEIYRNLQGPEKANEPLPPEVAIDPATGPWSVTFASDEDGQPQAGDDVPRELGPVTVRVDDGKIRVTVHGVRYEVGGKLHETAMDITAIYRLEQGPEGWRFVRDGEPTVFPPGRDPGKQGTLSIRETALRGEMQNRFQEKKTFPETIKIDHLVLGGEMAKAGELRVAQAVADDGWLMISWQAGDALAPVAMTDSVDR
ncbi:MAG: hypothetical protein SGJ19_16575 [Planctomycetia bacterium]|nr:hypothetical protein [Planctomycetia bacterium]